MELHLKPFIFLVLCFDTFHSYRGRQFEGEFEFRACGQPYKWGDIRNLYFPFWGANQPSYCGFPDFKVSCDNQSPSIFKINDVEYNIINISYSNPNITVRAARLDLLEGPCSKLVNFLNGSLSYQYGIPTYFSPAVEGITMFYGCDSDVANKPGLRSFLDFKLSCPTEIEGTRTVYYASDPLLDSVGSNLQELSCRKVFRVPVLKDALNESKISLGGDAEKKVGDAWQRGFEVIFPDNSCKECMETGGKCGYNSISYQFFTCLCPRGYKQQQPYCKHPGSKLNIVVITIGSPTFGIVIMFLVGIKICYHRKMSETSSCETATKEDQDLETFIKNYEHLTVKRYKFSEVKKMTEQFKDKLGNGGYGEVYKGKLFDDRLVAVKLLNASKGNGQEFINEVASISRTSHVNVVSLLGFCLDHGKRSLIYEFMSNGSLDKFIYNDCHFQSIPQLKWEKLLQIAIGIARGLEYLHRGCNIRILHFDIKPHNILLDEDLCPKISDFGLAKLCLKKESIVSLLDARGTIGYIAPEVFSRNFGGVSSKSDVYSYGMMIIEMVGGKKNIKNVVSQSSELYFPDWIYKLLQRESNLTLWGAMTSIENKIVRKMIIVGLWCVQTMPSDRPSMNKVIEMLEGSSEALNLPQNPSLVTRRAPEILPTELLEKSSTTSLLGN